MAKRRDEEVPIVEDNAEREKGEDPLQFPGDLRPGWVKEDIENEGRKPDLEEIEEDSSEL
jgi:hypothetical protein